MCYDVAVCDVLWVVVVCVVIVCEMKYVFLLMRVCMCAWACVVVDVCGCC